jgi:hypothetical protein
MIPVVRLHPHGGYAVVSMVEGAAIPEVIPGYHVQFATFHDACVAAKAEDIHGFGYRVDQEIP